MTHDVLYHLLLPSEFPDLEEIRDDESLGLSPDVKEWITETREDSDALCTLIEGDDEGDSWCGDADGIIVQNHVVPWVRCSHCHTRVETRDRLLPVPCPAALVRQLSEDMPSFETVGEFRRVAATWEELLRQQGTDIELWPGDVFQPSIWKDAVRLFQREVFAPFTSGGSLVVSDRLAMRFQEERIAGISMHELQVQSRFFPGEIPLRFQLFSTMQRWWNSDAIYQDHGHVRRECDQCGSARHDKDRDAWIESRKRFSRYRKQNVFPRHHVLPADVFTSVVYEGGLILTDKAFHLLSDVDLSFAKVREIRVVDDE